MTVSGSSDFSITTRQLIERSYRLVGALQSGATINSSQMTDARLILNSIIRELDLKRIGLFNIKQSSMTCVSGQASYTISDGLPSDIFRLESCLYVVSSNDERKVSVCGYQRYDDINDKTTRGDPILIFLSDEADLSSRTAKLWPVPDASKPIKLRYRRRSYDFDNDADNPDYPSEWFSCLSFLLASELIEEYAAEDAKVKRIQDMASLKLRELKSMSTKAVENPKEKNHEYY